VHLRRDVVPHGLLPGQHRLPARHDP
jgi:hypothetical protein